MPAIRVVMPDGTTKSFREGTPKSVIRRAQADMLAGMKASGEYEGCDLSQAEQSKKRKVTVTQVAPAPQPRPSRLSSQGDQFLRAEEGNSATMTPEQMRIYGVNPQTRVYGDIYSLGTYGIGHLMTPEEMARSQPELSQFTPEQHVERTEQLYGQDVERVYGRIRNQIGAERFDALPANVQDALIAEAFQTGSLGPRMVGAIQRGDMDAAANEFDAWHHTETVNGVRRSTVDPRLVGRQLRTREIFRNGNYGYQPSKDEIDDFVRNGARY